MTNVSDLFQRMPGTHIEAGEWGRRYSDDLGHAWGECPRGDWAIWIAAILETDHRLVAEAACDCARFALSLLPLDKQEEHLLPVIELAEGWARGELKAEVCAQAAKDVLAVFQDPATHESDDRAATAGYATSAVSAAVSVPTYTTTFGLACAASAAALTAAEVAEPIDETAILDAHRRCAELIRKRIQFSDLVATRGFKLYAKTVTKTGRVK